MLQCVGVAELTQHIPNKGEHLIRFYGCYSNKSRGEARKRAALAIADDAGLSGGDGAPAAPPAAEPASGKLRRRWAMLIEKVYQADPLTCPMCGGAMKIVAFIEARQGEVIERILRYCGLWKPPPRPPPCPRGGGPPSRPSATGPCAGPSDLDPDFLEHLHREAQAEQMELPWD
jgi:hypothetical protein